MFCNTLTFKFGKTIGLLYLLSAVSGIITILAEKLFYVLKHAPVPSYGLFFVVVLLLNAGVILVANFFIIQIILFVIDCIKLKKILGQPQKECPLSKEIFEYVLFALSLIVPIGYLAAILPNIK